MPWTCTNFGSESEIDARIEGESHWQTIATVRSIGSLEANDIADFLVKAVNSSGEAHAILKAIVPILESCLEGKGLTKPMTKDAELLLGRIKTLAEL